MTGRFFHLSRWIGLKWFATASWAWMPQREDFAVMIWTFHDEPHCTTVFNWTINLFRNTMSTEKILECHLFRVAVRTATRSLQQKLLFATCWDFLFLLFFSGFWTQLERLPAALATPDSLSPEEVDCKLKLKSKLVMEWLKDFQLKVGKMDVLESRVEILSDPAVDWGYELMVRTVFV